jgi:ADP-heptose:LPS heptosyltransferase
MKPLKNVLIIALASAPHGLLTLPLAFGIKARFPTARITLLIRNTASEALAGPGPIDETVVFDAEGLLAWLNRDDTTGFLQSYESLSHSVNDLRRRAFDTVFNFDHGRISAMLTRLLLCSDTRGRTFTADWTHIVRGAWPIWLAACRMHHRAQIFHPGDIFRRFGSPELPPPHAPLLSEAVLESDVVNRWYREQSLAPDDRPVCVWINATAAAVPLPVEKLAQLADTVITRLKQSVVLAGTSTDQKLGDLIASSMKHQPFTFFHDLPAAAWATFFKRTACFIAGPGITAHLAAAAGAHVVLAMPPGASLFPSIPWGEGHVVAVPRTSGTIGPAHLVRAITIALRQSETLPSSHESDVSAADLFLTRFDDAGMLELAPLNRRPLSFDTILDAAVRVVVRDSLDGAATGQNAFTTAVREYPLTPGTSAGIATRLTAAGAVARQFAALCAHGAAQANLLVGLCASPPSPQRQSQMQTFVRELGEIDKRIIAEGRTQDVIRTISLLFSSEKDNLDGATLADLAQATMRVYQATENRAQRLAELFETAHAVMASQ